MGVNGIPTRHISVTSTAW